MDVALEARKIDLRKRESKDQRQLKELLESIEELEVEISDMKAEITNCGDEGTEKSLRKKLDALQVRERSRKSMLKALHAPASSEGGQSLII